VKDVSFSAREDRAVVSQTGYQRLASPVTPVRTVTLRHDIHRLRILDEFEGEGDHLVEIPLHLAPGVEIRDANPARLVLMVKGKAFAVTWSSASDWTLDGLAGRVTPSYGVTEPSSILRGRRQGTLAPLAVELMPRI
jgi:hypothetical protein